MRKRFKICLIAITILIILIIVILVSLKFNHSDNRKVYKEFYNLKDTLNKEDIDYEAYATYLSELFIIDLFTMDNKSNKYDVGSVEYVLDDIKDNYSLNVQETIYKYLVDYTKRDESDIYSVVSSIEKETIENTKYSYNNNEYEAYKVTLNWTYEKDLGYVTKGEVTLIKKENKLYVVAYKGVE